MCHVFFTHANSEEKDMHRGQEKQRMDSVMSKPCHRPNCVLYQTKSDFRCLLCHCCCDYVESSKSSLNAWRDNWSILKNDKKKLFAEEWKCRLDEREFLWTKLYSCGTMAYGPKLSDVAECHTIICVDHESDLRNCLIFCQKQQMIKKK